MKYIALLILYSFLLVFDFLFILATIGIIWENKDTNAAVGCVIFSAFLIFLTLKLRSYNKRLSDAKENVPATVKAEKVDEPKSNDGVKNRNGKYTGIGCLLFMIPIVVACVEGWARWLLIAAIIFSIWGLSTGRFSKKSAIDNLANDDDEQKGTRLKPNFELKYKSAEGEVTLRKIYVRDFDGRVLDAYCFLRNEDRTFYIPRIVECIDLETGEVLSNETNGDLRWYFNEKFKKNFKPSDMFEFDEWIKMSFSSCSPFVDDISGFDVGEYFIMKIATYKEGFITGKFHCGKVYSSIYDSDGFYLVLDADNGERYNIEPNKIISVEGVDDIGRYINEKFLSSNEGKARRLQNECEDELSVFVYLGRADGSSLNDKKRCVICDYLNNTGRNCTSEILAVVARRISVDTNDFKKIVNAISKSIEPSNKLLLLAAANEIVGGKEKAKPFGLAGLLYLESKIKV